MTDVAPEAKDVGVSTEGKPAALAVWILFALTPLTTGLTAVIGVIVAYTQKARAGDLVQTHFEMQIRLFWSALIWMVLFTVAWWISLALTTVVIGIPLVFLFWAAILLLGTWFMVRAVVGAMALTGDRAP